MVNEEYREEFVQLRQKILTLLKHYRITDREVETLINKICELIDNVDEKPILH